MSNVRNSLTTHPRKTARRQRALQRLIAREVRPFSNAEQWALERARLEKKLGAFA